MAFNTYHRNDNACSYGTVSWASGSGVVAEGLIKTGAGFLRSYAVSWTGGLGAITLYDSLTATTGNAIINAFSNGSTTTVVDFGVDVPFATGLYVLSTGSIKATVFYY